MAVNLEVWSTWGRQEKTSLDQKPQVCPHVPSLASLEQVVIPYC